MFKRNIYEKPLDNQLFSKNNVIVVKIVKSRRLHKKTILVCGSKIHRIDIAHKQKGGKEKKVKLKINKANPSMINVPSPASLKKYVKLRKNYL
jgi:hypothetical protein